jgi:eukaryotic-like serine/threonine-protein kinase
VGRRAGGLVADRYRLERVIGRGAMGEVWSATHTITRRRFALKLLRAPVDASPEVVERMIREARAASLVDHPNVVTVHDLLVADGGTPILVMELVDGETMAAKIKRDAPLALADACALLAQLGSAVGAAHARGIVHRDLKPQNAMLVGGCTVKVLDFGIAKLGGAPDGDATTTGRALGTPQYMAPEQCRGERDVDHRADIWAIGVMIYELLSGRRPIAGDSIGEIVERLLTEGVPPLRALAPEAPFELAVLARSMLERDRERRPHDLREAVAIFSRLGSVEVPGFGAPGSDTVVEPAYQPGPSPGDSSHSVAHTVNETARGSPRGRTGFRIVVAAGAVGLAALGAWRWSAGSRGPVPPEQVAQAASAAPTVEPPRSPTTESTAPTAEEVVPAVTAAPPSHRGPRPAAPAPRSSGTALPAETTAAPPASILLPQPPAPEPGLIEKPPF